MSQWMRGLIICSLTVVGLGGCTGVKFAALPSKACQSYASEFGSDACRLTPDGFNHFNYPVEVGTVDILVVDDNSGSMYPEQSEMANRFPGFLDSIFRLNYRLAIVTTDILQNGGGFLSFPNGQKYLANGSRAMDANHYANINFFQQTIKRPETLLCDSSGYTNCPSGDERGIFALNLAMQRTDQKSFFRPSGHLAVIILSDEDERSNGGAFAGYPLETNDLPSTFVSNTKSLLGASKSVSVHSIIVQPNDTNCLATQSNQPGVKGFYGTQYAALSNPSAELRSLGNIVTGASGSICSTNYTTELGNIASKLNQTISEIQLPCAPENGQAQIAFTPAPPQVIYYTIDSSNRLHLNPAVEAGTRVQLEFDCRI